jgi:hypothetical protein
VFFFGSFFYASSFLFLSVVFGSGDTTSHTFLISLPDESEWSNSHLGRFQPGGGIAVIHWMGGQMSPRAGLDDVEKRKSVVLVGNQTLIPWFSSP